MNNKMIFFFFFYALSVSSFFFYRQPASFSGGRNDAIKNVFRRRLRFRMYFPRKTREDERGMEGREKRGARLVVTAAVIANVKSVCATKLICRFLGSFPPCSI